MRVRTVVLVGAVLALAVVAGAATSLVLNDQPAETTEEEKYNTSELEPVFTTYYENQTPKEAVFTPADVERQHSADVYEDIELENSQLIGNSCSVTVRVDNWNDDGWLIIQTTDTSYTPNKTAGDALTVPAKIGTDVTVKSGGTGEVLLRGRVEITDENARRYAGNSGLLKVEKGTGCFFVPEGDSS